MNLFFLLILSFSVFAKDPSIVWGKIVKSEKAVKNVTYKYFVTFESGGKLQAYPIDTKDKKIAEEIEKNENQMVRISGDIKTAKVIVDGPPQDIPVFVPEKVNVLKLADLSVNDNGPEPGPKNPFQKSEKEPFTGKIRINDTLANTMIITGGALLLGSALLQSLKKK